MNKLLSLPTLVAGALLMGCTAGSVDEPRAVTDPSEQVTVSFALSRTSQSEFASAGITDISIYTYTVLRVGTELYSKQTVAVSDGQFEFSFPLGETYQAFAVANASSITDDEALSTVALHLDPLDGSDVWLSAVSKFTTDKTVSEITLQLKRVVARLTFKPAETADELAAITSFDNIDVTFGNVASEYLVGSSTAIATEVTRSASKVDGYETTLLTFETTALDETGTVDLVYTLGGTHVNTSASVLDTGVNYESSRRYDLVVPITSSSFTATAFGIPASRGLDSFSITSTPL